jgi:uncharacterized membrane protein YciS (DUF1049 family)
MKNIKYVYKFLLVLPLVFMAGCVGSDDYQDVLSNQTAQQSTVFIETDDASQIAHGTLINSEETIKVGINNSQTDDLTVSFNVTKDGAAAVEGVDYDLADSVIESGDYFGSSIVTFYTEGRYEVTVNSAGALDVVANKAIFIVLAPVPITFTLSWDDSFYDYDIFYLDGIVPGFSDIYSNALPDDINLLGFSNGFSNVESFIGTPTYGFSYIYMEDYYNDNASIPCVLTIDIDGDEQVFNITMDADKFGLSIEASIDDEGNLVYDFTVL